MKKPIWLSDEILIAIRESDELKKELQKGRIQRESFKAARNKVVRLVEKAKKEAIVNEINENKLNLRALWKTLKNIFPTEAKRQSKIHSLDKDGRKYSTSKDISNLFNEHFVSIADNIIGNNVAVDPDFTKLNDFVKLLKGEDSTEFRIPTLSEYEVSELINCKHLMAFLTEYSLLYKYQSGFRSNHSCETILLKLIDEWLEAMDKSQFTGVVMLDLRKAFDVVNRQLLSPDQTRTQVIASFCLCLLGPRLTANLR